MDSIRILVHESMFILDGGPGAGLPSGSGGPVLAGPEAVFIAGRVEHDAPTLFRIGSLDDHGDLTLAYSGVIATPQQVLRVLNVDQKVLGETTVAGSSTWITIYLTDLEEPDEIFVAIAGAAEAPHDRPPLRD